MSEIPSAHKCGPDKQGTVIGERYGCLICGKRWEWQDTNSITGYAALWTRLPNEEPMDPAQRALPPNAWDDLVQLAKDMGYECVFEHRVTQQTVIRCEPHAYDEEFPPPHPWPDNWFDADELQVCRVHNEFWPCSVLALNGGYTYRQPDIENVLVVRPRKDPS